MPEVTALIERLRKCHCGPNLGARDHRVDCAMRREAADEIERLTAEHEALRVTAALAITEPEELP